VEDTSAIFEVSSRLTLYITHVHAPVHPVRRWRRSAVLQQLLNSTGNLLTVHVPHIGILVLLAQAVEEKRKAEDISAVLYPNDATEYGKELRLKQQFFFVSASIQVRSLVFVKPRCCRRPHQQWSTFAADVAAAAGADIACGGPFIKASYYAAAAVRMAKRHFGQRAVAKPWTLLFAGCHDPLRGQAQRLDDAAGEGGVPAERHAPHHRGAGAHAAAHRREGAGLGRRLGRHQEVPGVHQPHGVVKTIVCFN